MKIDKRKLNLVNIVFFVAAVFLLMNKKVYAQTEKPNNWWEFQSIDTMKYSRDTARAKLKDSSFNEIIEIQVKNIAETGATHVGIATPYDEEFVPFLKRWVDAARRYNLNIWFRGNFSGWEGWFEYPKISREDHIKKTVEFISKNSDIFQSGDIFSACPECENGGPGDPRLVGDVEGYRNFLIEEYKQTSNTFRNLGKNVKSNFQPMNGDVAKLVMDKETTRALGGLVVIDHYVETPLMLVKDIENIALSSGGKVVLGEFGAPIPDIHGNFTELEQANWISSAFKELINVEKLVGINYWVNVGGSTEIWNQDNSPREAVTIISEYFKPNVSDVYVQNELGQKLSDVKITFEDKEYHTDEKGYIHIKYIETKPIASFEKEGYFLSKNNINDSEDTNVTLVKENESVVFKFRKFLVNFFRLFNSN